MELFLYIFKYFHLTCSNISFLEHRKYSNCFNALLYSFYYFVPFLDLFIFVDFSPYHGLCFPAYLHAWWFLSYARHSEFYLIYCWVFCTSVVNFFFFSVTQLSYLERVWFFLRLVSNDLLGGIRKSFRLISSHYRANFTFDTLLTPEYSNSQVNPQGLLTLASESTNYSQLCVAPHD